jgi:hypothetical protein
VPQLLATQSNSYSFLMLVFIFPVFHFNFPFSLPFSSATITFEDRSPIKFWNLVANYILVVGSESELTFWNLVAKYTVFELGRQLNFGAWL